MATESSSVEHIGAFRFDDPLGEVGIETFLARVDRVIVQVPLTYRAAPLAGADDALVGTTEHSVLGTRWVYDGLGDPIYPVMLAAVTMTGQGEALGMVQHDGRWVVAPATVRISGGGWTTERVVVDGFEIVDHHDDGVTLRGGDLDLRFYRTPVAASSASMTLTASWGEAAGDRDTESGDPDDGARGVVLASVSPHP